MTVIWSTLQRWDAHLRLYQPVKTRHYKTKTEATATYSIPGPKFSSLSAPLPISQSPWKSIAPEWALPTSYKERKAEEASVVVSFWPPRDHATCLSSTQSAWHVVAFRTSEREFSSIQTPSSSSGYRMKIESVTSTLISRSNLHLTRPVTAWE